MPAATNTRALSAKYTSWPNNVLPQSILRYWRTIWLLSTLILYLALATYQLGLPGLHYDEAKEAGVNAVELLNNLPTSAFREASVSFAGWQLPLMVQDYIGALNVYLALPLLKLTGIGVPNLRFLSILTGLLALMTLERAVSAYTHFATNRQSSFRLPTPASATPISLAGLISTTLLAASPSFVFWSRQGIFVTNLIQPLCFLAIWQGISWLRSGRQRALILSAFCAGLALYAKLLAIWIIAPFALMVMATWLWFRVRGELHRARLSPALFAMVLGAFVLPLLPLIAFNLQTGGTFSNVSQNLGQSYYGVDNLDLLQNATIRWQQLLDTLRGSHLWYLGGIFRNPLAPWLAIVAVAGGLLALWRVVLPPLLLLAFTFTLSLFTITDLFITHYAVVQLLLVAVVGIAIYAVYLGSVPRTKNWTQRAQRMHRGHGERQEDFLTFLPSAQITPDGGPEKSMRVSRHVGAEERASFSLWNSLFSPCGFCVALFLVLWLGLDIGASVRYHSALTQSGGLSDHADASYDLAYHLRYNGMGAPIVLDWGMDATIRYLSEGTVRPIEIFGYASPAVPDDGFVQRLTPFLDNVDNVYLLHAPEQTVFGGRRELFFQQADAQGLTAQLEAHFAQRDGTPLFELWRVTAR